MTREEFLAAELGVYCTAEDIDTLWQKLAKLMESKEGEETVCKAINAAKKAGFAFPEL